MTVHLLLIESLDRHRSVIDYLSRRAGRNSGHNIILLLESAVIRSANSTTLESNALERFRQCFGLFAAPQQFIGAASVYSSLPANFAAA
jgi:hypothetical protein